MEKLCKIFHRHFEWVALSAGLAGLIFLDPFEITHKTLCLFEYLGIPCPGEGLGRSIALIFRGYFKAAWELQPTGYLALAVLLPHIGALIHKRIVNPNSI